MIIGIAGKKGVGKDTVAGIIKDELDCGCEIMSFSSHLKDGCKAIFGFTEEQVNGAEKEVVDTYWGETPRKVLQFVGTELFREKMQEILKKAVKGNFWIDVLKRKIKESKKKTVVISDVRFQNEADFIINEMDGLLIHIKRPKIDIDTKHTSETSVDKLEGLMYNITNDGSIEDLRKKISTIFQLL